MSIFEDKWYGVGCDQCGEIYEDARGHFVFVEAYMATDRARKEGWREIDGKWYCPKCVEKLFTYNEKTDKYERKEEQK